MTDKSPIVSDFNAPTTKNEALDFSAPLSLERLGPSVGLVVQSGIILTKRHIIVFLHRLIQGDEVSSNAFSENDDIANEQVALGFDLTSGIHLPFI